MRVNKWVIKKNNNNKIYKQLKISATKFDGPKGKFLTNNLSLANCNELTAPGSCEKPLQHLGIYYKCVVRLYLHIMFPDFHLVMEDIKIASAFRPSGVEIKIPHQMAAAAATSFAAEFIIKILAFAFVCRFANPSCCWTKIHICVCMYVCIYF